MAASRPSRKSNTTLNAPASKKARTENLFDTNYCDDVIQMPINIPDIPEVDRTFDGILIGMDTVRYMLETTDSTAWMGKTRQFWMQFSFVAFTIGDFKETWSEKMFQLLCPRPLTTKLIQRNDLFQYFKDQYDSMQKVYNSMAAVFGGAWLDSPAGQHLQELATADPNGNFDFDLPNSASDLYKWKGFAGLEFPFYSLVAFLLEPLRCLETVPTSDGNISWISAESDPDGYWTDSQWNRVCRLIISWVVTVGLYGRLARREGCLEMADIHTIAPSKYQVRPPRMKNVVNLGIFLDDMIPTTNHKPSDDLRTLPAANCHYYTLAAVIAGHRERETSVDYGKGTQGEPFNRIGSLPVDYDCWVDDSNDEKSRGVQGYQPVFSGIHPITKHNAASIARHVDSESRQLPDTVLQDTSKFGVKQKKESNGRVTHSLGDTPHDPGDEVGAYIKKSIHISNQPLSTPRANLGCAFSVLNEAGQFRLVPPE
ncbi:hypothetical protein BJ508DRAFT_334531 [Ascobolus immersus RN42]|uniref:Uncharacterized protein n=1 Tax=Ascobolus immersus RN42 TaxID=1160509 RepID=A0A3N4HTK7_ASCIM|nr:hypothetical protein BJ508DRAFT_334531 [Ascobolus immersus RN42]